MPAAPIDYGTASADRGQVAEVPIMEVSNRAAENDVGNKFALLLGHRRDAWQRSSARPGAVGSVADRKDFGMAGNSKILLHENAAEPVALGVEP